MKMKKHTEISINDTKHSVFSHDHREKEHSKKKPMHKMHHDKKKESKTYDKVKNSKLGSGARFAALSRDVAKSYEKKGMSEKKAKEIGGEVAPKIGREKYGNKKMALMAKKGKK